MKFISNINKCFIRNSILNHNKRIDFRSLQDSRELTLNFGEEFGTCFVRLGQTILLATTCCDITEPKISRPNEGVIELSLDISSGAEKWLDSYQRLLPEEGIHCLRLLERTIRDSHCVDTESLCLVANEKVWRIRCHLICLNFDGNLTEAASIAAIASLSHFKRPDVSVSSDGKLTIHSFEERNALKLSLLHYPFCVTFVFFEGKQNNHLMVCDPLEVEEDSSDGTLLVCANSYHQIVGLHSSGKSVVDRNQTKTCFNIAIERVKHLTHLVKNAIDSDTEKRSKLERVGFAHAMQTGLMAAIARPHFNLLDVIKMDAIEEPEPTLTTKEETVSQNVYLYGRGISGIGEGGESKWQLIEPILDIDPDVRTSPQMHNNSPLNTTIQLTNSEDEEEDEIIILDPNHFSQKH